jgi:hypothetical protein
MNLKKMKTLNKIQKELKAPKGQKNTFGNYNYRSCEDILEAVKPLLGDAVLTIQDEIVLIGDRYYVKATATLTEDEKSISTSAFARESLDKKGMDSAQITGATSSYARKYALNGLFCIDDTKDADTKDNTEPVVKTKVDPYKSAIEAIEATHNTVELSRVMERVSKSNKLTADEKENCYAAAAEQEDKFLQDLTS